MLVSIGRRAEPAEPEDLVGLLLACHQRIRHFSRLSLELGRSAAAAPLEEVIEASQRCERYFVEALPLHVADEEESVLPRLAACGPDVGAALDAMRSQHAAHAVLLGELLACLRAVREEPHRRSCFEALASIAERVVAAFEEHLEIEERVIFPALRSAVSPEHQTAAIEELRSRRSRP